MRIRTCQTKYDKRLIEFREIFVERDSGSLIKLEDLPNQLRSVEWNGAESTLFRVLHETFLNNFCAISQLIKTKSCQEVSAQILMYLFITMSIKHLNQEQPS